MGSAAVPEAPAVFGVGPSNCRATASGIVFHPSLVNIPSVNLDSLLRRTVSSASATDVWFFVRGATTAAMPASLLELFIWQFDRHL
jgi:hypothetical protein